MNISVDNRQMNEAGNIGIYAHLKTLVKTHELPPNTHLMISGLSAKLGYCEQKAVRDALFLLSREGLIMEIPFKGYYTRKFSGSEICKLYEVNKIVLDRSLERLQGNPDLNGIIQFPQMFSMKENMTVPESISPGKIVQVTYDLFMHIVHQSERPELIRIALKVNERLNYIRACECVVIDSPEEELGHLCQLYHRKNIHELRRAIDEYHVSRFKIIPKIMEIL